MSAITTDNLQLLLQKLQCSLPRYTSYPTAPIWGPIDTQIHQSLLQSCSKPLSLYLHLPFCAKMCLFCGCSVVINHKQQREAEYVDWLCQEIDMTCALIGSKATVTQIHWGGGTPTKLSSDLIERLFRHLEKHFHIDEAAEIAIEIDPRTISAEPAKLTHLRTLGFNRVSFGVQDMDEKVQAAINRHQSASMSIKTFELAKTLGFDEINLDLIYGLPYQSRLTFAKTIEQILQLSPDRIALFSYAQIPHLKPHQRAIKADTLPSRDEKFAIYASARQLLIEAGYVAIGMDHFALKSSELAISYKKKTLHRNFQGYTVKKAETLLGFGMSAISNFSSGYFQNEKELTPYGHALANGKLPLLRGHLLSEDDRLRQWVISEIMCRFEVDKNAFRNQFGVDFDLYFPEVNERLALFEKEGLLVQTSSFISISALGELFVRNIAAQFDYYLSSENRNFSSSI